MRDNLIRRNPKVIGVLAVAIVGLALAVAQVTLPWSQILNVSGAVLIILAFFNFVLAVLLPKSQIDDTASEVSITVTSKSKSSASTLPENPNPVLINAWRRFISYDVASIKLKQERIFLRTIIISLGVIISALAVLVSYDSSPNVDSSVLVRLMKIALAVLPIVVSILIAYASEFSPSTAWAVYRVGAELIRREIILYRMKIGDYAVENKQDGQVGDDNKTRDQKFVENINKASRLEKIYDSDKMDNPVIEDAVKQVLDGNARYPHPTRIGNDDEIVRIVAYNEKVMLETRLQKFLSYLTIPYRRYRKFSDWLNNDYKSSTYQPQQDDGFSDLTVERYIDVRLLPQLDWYIKRIKRDYDSFRKWKRRILIMGGVGSILVAVAVIIDSKLEPLVAVTTSLAVALGLYLELLMYNHTYLIYSAAKRQLLDLHDRWFSTLKDTNNPEKDKLHANFVRQVEDAFQSEREQWMLRVIQTQTALEQKLAKSDETVSSPQDTVKQEHFELLKQLANRVIKKAELNTDDKDIAMQAIQIHSAVVTYAENNHVLWVESERNLFESSIEKIEQNLDVIAVQKARDAGAGMHLSDFLEEISV